MIGFKNESMYSPEDNRQFAKSTGNVIYGLEKRVMLMIESPAV